MYLFENRGFLLALWKRTDFLRKSLRYGISSSKYELGQHTPKPGRVPVRTDITILKDGPESYEANFIGLIFKCAHCEEEHYFAFRIDGQSIYKVGQFPSFSREHTQDLKKYKNLISKYYTELTSAVNLYSQNVGIAAFVYLRRILEHLVNTKYFVLPDASGDAKFIEKLKAVENVEVVIPSELAEIKEQIYSVLSKGIHEYSEQECLDLFDTVLFVITAILDQELYKKEQAEKAANAKKMIAKKLKK